MDISFHSKTQTKSQVGLISTVLSITEQGYASDGRSCEGPRLFSASVPHCAAHD